MLHLSTWSMEMAEATSDLPSSTLLMTQGTILPPADVSKACVQAVLIKRTLRILKAKECSVQEW